MPRPRNAFLRSLPEKAYGALASQLTPVDLELAVSLRHPSDAITWVYFPEGALGSVLGSSATGDTVEISVVGNEGADGLTELCGSGVSSLEVKVQLPGRAWRAPAGVVRDLVFSDKEFSQRVWVMTEFHMGEARQSALCNAMHLVESRLARWLLESYDRSDRRNPLTMTQEFIGAMLGVQRSTVSAFAAQLQKSGLIDYRRGVIGLRDMEGLERRACDCRAITRAQRERLGLALASE